LLPYPEEIDLKKLKRDSPEVFAIWNLRNQIDKRVFGEKSLYYDISAEQDMRLQRFGEQIVPDLLAGTYDAGFRSGPLAKMLANYHGPVIPEIPKSKLLHAETVHFLEYTAPPYPPLARTARISGVVSLELIADTKTGNIQDVHKLTGHPMLVDSASAAARRWRLDPAQENLMQPVRVDLSFSLECPK
jgi:TonB family protein